MNAAARLHPNQTAASLSLAAVNAASAAPINAPSESITGPAAAAAPPPPPTEDSVSGSNNAAGDFDVNKLDTSALQDVIQYSGVDLKAEAEMIMKHHHHGDNYAQQAPVGRDPRSHHDYFLNPARLKALVSAAAMPRGITDMSEDCLDMIALAVQRRLANIIEALGEISKHRADQGRSHFKIKIENDPKKLMWIVEQHLVAENERVNAGQGAFGSAEALALARAKMKRASEKRASEDVAIKTKLANVTAAAATGLQLKSWMTEGAAAAAMPLVPASSDLSLTSNPADPSSATKPALHISQAPSMTPMSDRELQIQLASRTVTLKDLVYYAETDPHLRHSNLLLSLYSQLGM